MWITQSEITLGTTTVLLMLAPLFYLFGAWITNEITKGKS